MPSGRLIILEHIDAICAIVDSKIKDRTKKNRLIKLLGEGSADIATYILTLKPVQLETIRYIQRKIANENTIDSQSDYTRDSRFCRERVVVVGGSKTDNSTASEFLQLLKD